jgi:hypothetical protein
VAADRVVTPAAHLLAARLLVCEHPQGDVAVSIVMDAHPHAYGGCGRLRVLVACALASPASFFLLCKRKRTG